MIELLLQKGNVGYIVEDPLAERYDYIWLEGNYSCDCNRSLFIQRCADPDFPLHDCGDSIALIGFREKKDK